MFSLLNALLLPRRNLVEYETPTSRTAYNYAWEVQGWGVTRPKYSCCYVGYVGVESGRIYTR